MQAKDVLERMRTFLAALKEHFELYGKSLSTSWMADGPVKNRDALSQQQVELTKQLYVLNPFISQFTLVRQIGAYGQYWDVFLTAVSDDIPQRKHRSIETAIQHVEGIISRLELEDPKRDISPTGRRQSSEQRIFISHGTETPALARLMDFLRALGCYPVVVKKEPSQGGAVDDVVPGQMDTCAAGVVFATRDEEIGGEGRPRPNVIHEIGVMQQKQMRLIYLKEVGCQFPSNVAPKLWENFTQESMDAAFTKLTIELRAFGLL